MGQIDERLNPDLNDIMHNYVEAGSVFLVTCVEEEIVGTGALITEAAGIGRIVRVSTHHAYRRNGIRKNSCEALDRGSRAIDVSSETNNDWQDQ